MFEAMEYAPPAGVVDLVEAVRDVLRTSHEPLTLARIRDALPSAYRRSVEELAALLQRQVAAQVIYLYPKYRSASDRYWDRPMRVHVARLVRGVLKTGPLAWSELRRRLPDYAKLLAESVLRDEVARGGVFVHPPLGPRLGRRFGLTPPRVEPYLQQELDTLFGRMRNLGFGEADVRSALLALLRTGPAPAVRTPWAQETLDEQECLDERIAMGQTLVPDTMF